MGTPDIAFGYASNEVKAFTDGDCWELARQIHLVSGYTLVTLGSEEEASDWYHAAVRLPDGRIVDIEGVWEEMAWLASWGERMYHNSLVCNEWELTALLADLRASEITEPWFPESAHSEVYAQEILAKVEASVTRSLVAV